MQHPLPRGSFSNLEYASSLEWLLTNGIGGFCSSTVSLSNTRRYHGLLCAALEPPGGRNLIVSSCDEVCRFDSGKSFELAAHYYQDGTVHPHGYRFLRDFYVENQQAVWVYLLEDVVLEKRIWMGINQNTTYVRYQVLSGSQEFALSLSPLCSVRDYHSQSRGQREYKVQHSDRTIAVTQASSNTQFFIEFSQGEFHQQESWNWNIHHPLEAYRGLDCEEDLYSPGSINARLDLANGLLLSISMEPKQIARAKKSLEDLDKLQSNSIKKLPKNAPQWIKDLCLAAQQFIVQRETGKSIGTSIIAGYPWFMDWTRDTMISLPGLTLSLGRTDLARSILETYAHYLQDGMLPNRFLENPEEMEFNSVDAALLFVYAVQCLDETGEKTAVLGKLYPAIEQIISHYSTGTRYQIKEDPKDGLITAGEEGVQLTWMDAKVGDWVVTPRRGKAVEINALWYNALVYAAALAQKLGFSEQSIHYSKKAKLTKKGFQSFWNEEQACLFDVLQTDTPEPDAAIRPNQLFAVALPASALTKAQQRSIVDICAQKLLTPVGLRSLTEEDPAYQGTYGGDQRSRDAAYHQGTVWTWPLGYFVRAHLKVYGKPEKSLEYLKGIEAHLSEAGIGTISEVFDADPPHQPRGCFAQAWSVAEILHAWRACEQALSTKKG